MSVDNYIKHIDYTMQRRLFHDKKSKKGYDIIIPGVRVCAGEMINYWLSHINDNLREIEQKKCELQEEISELQKKIKCYNKEIRSIMKVASEKIK